MANRKTVNGGAPLLTAQRIVLAFAAVIAGGTVLASANLTSYCLSSLRAAPMLLDIVMSAIVTPDVLGRFRITTLTLEDLASCDGKELGGASNPYAVIGLIISKAVVKANANLNSTSRGVALKSTSFPPETGQNQIDLCFAKPQGGFGFFYRVIRATSLSVKVLDSRETVLEEHAFHDGEGYAGVIRVRAEIGIVRIVARSETLSIAEDSSFYIDDLSFGRELK